MSGTGRGTAGRTRGGLGRGLGALIPSAPPAPPAPTEPAPSATSIDLPPGAEPDSTPEQANGTEPVTAPAGADTPKPAADAGPEPAAAGMPTPADAGAGAGAGAGAETGADAEIDGLRPVPGARMAELAITDIRANAVQPRGVFDDDALAELTHSVQEFGVLQPVVVRPTPDGPTPYELVMGERRLRASTAAGLATIPAVVRETADDAMLRDALLENIHRAQLNPLEEAAAYQQLLEEFGATHDELAGRIGRSRSQVSNTIRLLNLPVAVQRRVAAGVLSAGHARALLGLPDAASQDELATRIVAEGMSVRATEEAVTLFGMSDAPDTATSRARPRRNLTAPALAGLADRLSDALDTRVRVDLGRRKGKVTVEFATIDDLERIVAIIAPGVAARRPPA